jgi:hypothetical protein
MDEVLNPKTQQKEEKKRELRRFSTLVKLLFSDTSKLSFKGKAERKSSLLKITSSLLIFAGLTGLDYLLYFVAELFRVFSLLSLIPQMVPSFIVSILLLVSLLNATVRLTRSLYYSPDNRMLITYPAKGLTVFLARLVVFFVAEYARSVMVIGPILFAYMLISGFPFYLYLWFFVALFFVVLSEVVLAALLSVPGFFVSRFLRQNSLIELIVYGLLFASFIGVVSWLMSLLPNKIDIFSNWGPYFARIQGFLKDYRDSAYPLYCLTLLLIGFTNGFSVPMLNLQSFWTLLVLLGIIVFGGILVFWLVSKLYLRLASESFEYTSNSAVLIRQTHQRSFFFAQLSKEMTLLIKDPGTFMSLFGVFVILPIFITILDKVFGAMNTTVIGNMYISVVNILILLLVSLNSNGNIAHIYSDEGKAFFINRSYPRSANVILLSKLVLPMLMGFISIIVSCIMYGQVTGLKLAPDGSAWVNGEIVAFLAVALCSFYAGHLLFAAGLDFTSIKSAFSAETLESSNERNIVLSAFVISLTQAVLFFLFLRDGVRSSYVKLMIIGLVFLALNIALFHKKSKYIYQKGE